MEPSAPLTSALDKEHHKPILRMLEGHGYRIREIDRYYQFTSYRDVGNYTLIHLQLEGLYYAGSLLEILITF